MVVVALLSVDLVESVDLVFVDLVVNCTIINLLKIPNMRHCSFFIMSYQYLDAEVCDIFWPLFPVSGNLKNKIKITNLN